MKSATINNDENGSVHSPKDNESPDPESSDNDDINKQRADLQSCSSLTDLPIDETPRSQASKRKTRKIPERKAKCPFSVEEDDFLLKGLRKYGTGKWTRVLKDPDFKFHPSRTNATLMTRAKVKKFV